MNSKQQPKPKPEKSPTCTDVQGFAGRIDRARKSESVYRYPFRLLNVINFITRQP